MKKNKNIGEIVFITLIILTILIIIALMINLYAINKGYNNLIAMIRNEKSSETMSSKEKEENSLHNSEEVNKISNLLEEVNKTSNFLNEKTNESNKSTLEAITFSDSPYDNIINEYKTAMNDTNYNLENAEIKYKYINQNMIQYYHNMNFKICYAYYDINKDNIDELLILSQLGDSNYTIIDIFSHNGFEPIKLISEYSLGERSKLQIFENGILYLAGSGGATNGILTFYKIGFAGNLQEYGKYYYVIDSNNNIAIYDNEEYNNKLDFSSIDDVVNLYKEDSSYINLNELELTEIK